MQYKLSLGNAILVNMNIMLGSGIFLNPVLLSTLVGPLSPVSYLTVGILIIPLILSIAQLLTIYPDGNFYEFGAKEISVLAGFISGWSYFVGKLAAATLMLHFGISILQQTIPALQLIPTIAFDIGILLFFTYASLRGMKTGDQLQKIFMSLKLIPIAFVILVGFYWFSPTNFEVYQVHMDNFPKTIALILYAFTGFEASCSLASHIKNAKVNAPKSILYAFLIVLTLTTLFQLCFYAVISLKQLATTSSFYGLQLFVNSLFPDQHVKGMLALLQSAVGLSAIGGSYGILYSNMWNLYALGKNRLVWFSDIVTYKNSMDMPVACIVAEALICGIYLATTQGHQVSLQLIGAFGCSITYTICVWSLIKNHLRTKTRKNAYIAILGLGASLFLLVMILHSFYSVATVPLFAFLGVIIAGVFMMRQNLKTSI